MIGRGCRSGPCRATLTSLKAVSGPFCSSPLILYRIQFESHGCVPRTGLAAMTIWLGSGRDPDWPSRPSQCRSTGRPRRERGGRGDAILRRRPRPDRTQARPDRKVLAPRRHCVPAQPMPAPEDRVRPETRFSAASARPDPDVSPPRRLSDRFAHELQRQYPEGWPAPVHSVTDTRFGQTTRREDGGSIPRIPNWTRFSWSCQGTAVCHFGGRSPLPDARK